MTWFKVDDNLAHHPKVIAAGNAALGLWVRAGSWAAQQLTDGFVPDTVLPALGTKKQADQLVAAGLWSRVLGGYVFHEWTERQPTRDEVETRRKRDRERIARWREQRGKDDETHE